MSIRGLFPIIGGQMTTNEFCQPCIVFNENDFNRFPGYNKQLLSLSQSRNGSLVAFSCIVPPTEHTQLRTAQCLIWSWDSARHSWCNGTHALSYVQSEWLTVHLPHKADTVCMCPSSFPSTRIMDTYIHTLTEESITLGWTTQLGNAIMPHCSHVTILMPTFIMSTNMYITHC